MTYDIGDQVRIRGTFTVEGTPTDPDTITLYVRKPGDTTPTAYVYGTDPEIIREGEGVYYADFIIDWPHIWHYKWRGTGAATAAEEGSFSVSHSNFYPF